MVGSPQPFAKGRAAERVWMALKSGRSVPHRNSAWRGMLAAGLLAAAFPAASQAQDYRQAIESAVSPDQIQRDYPSAERPRASSNTTRPATPETDRSPSEPSSSASVPTMPV